MSHSQIISEKDEKDRTPHRENLGDIETADTMNRLSLTPVKIIANPSIQQNFFAADSTTRPINKQPKKQDDNDLKVRRLNTQGEFDDNSDNEANELEKQKSCESIEMDDKGTPQNDKPEIITQEKLQLRSKHLNTRISISVTNYDESNQHEFDGNFINKLPMSESQGEVSNKGDIETETQRENLDEEKKIELSANSKIKESIPKKSDDLEVEITQIKRETDREGDKSSDFFVQNIKFDEDGFGRFRSDSLRSDAGEMSRNTSQVFHVSDYDRLMADPSPVYKPARKSRFHRAEDSSPVSKFKFSDADLLSIEKTSIDLQKSTSARSQEGRATSPSKNWRRVSLVVRSVIYMRNERVRSISNAQEMYQEMEDYKLVKVRNLYADGTKKDLATDNFVTEALESIRTAEIFCDCASIGSEKHIKLMQKILEEDPRRNLLSRTDTTHVLNRLNRFGQNALYLASKFGNLDTVKFLLDQQADPHIKSNVDIKNSTQEKCLHAAVRWGHAEIVSLLVQRVQFERQDLKLAIKQTERRDLKKILIDAYRDKYGGLGCLFSLLYT